MKIEIFHYEKYMKKVSGEFGDPLQYLPELTINSDTIITDSISNITETLVIDNEIYLQDASELSITVKFNQTLFNILFTKQNAKRYILGKLYKDYIEYSDYVVRAFKDNEVLPFFDGIIKFAGNKISSDFNNITFSAWDFLILIKEYNENVNASNENNPATGIIAPYINVSYLYNAGIDYFASGSAIQTIKIDDTEPVVSPLAEIPESHKITIISNIFSTGLPEIALFCHTFEIKTETTGTEDEKYKDTLFIHVLFTQNPSQYISTGKYGLFKIFNATEFEQVGSFEEITINENGNIDLAMLQNALLVKSGVEELNTSASYNGAEYRQTWGGNGIIPTGGSFNFEFNLYGTITLYKFKAENNELFKKCLFFMNWGLKFIANTLYIKNKLQFSIPNAITLSDSNIIQWEVETVEKTLIDTTIFDGITSVNNVDPLTGEPSTETNAISYLEYWLNKRNNDMLDMVSIIGNLTNINQNLDIGSDIYIENFPKTIKFKISEISYNPQLVNVQECKFYNINRGE